MICYHGIESAEAFRPHLSHIATHYQPVTGEQVEAAVHHNHGLPRSAVWVTFDDGDPSVVETGLALLQEYGVPATLFLCPGVIDTEVPYWWHMIQQALEAGIPIEVDGTTWRDGRVITHLKQVSDTTRRAVVLEVNNRLTEARGSTPRQRQLTKAQLRRWCDAGYEVGNHTWDHPLLDRCTASAQREQIRAADAWLSAEAPTFRRYFAYPNGSVTPAAREVLSRGQYRLGLTFNHRISRTTEPPDLLSRLRLDADASLPTLRARLSGAHPALFGLTRLARQDARAVRRR